MADRYTSKAGRPRRLAATGSASASGTVTAGASAATKSATETSATETSATELTDRRINVRTKPGRKFRPGFLFAPASPRHCEERSEAIHPSCADEWIASRSLSSLRERSCARRWARIRATRWLAMRALSVDLLRRADRAQHRFARPAIDLEPGRFLIGSEGGARQHSRFTVELVLVEAETRQSPLHRLDIDGAQLRRRRPWCCERQRARHAV